MKAAVLTEPQNLQVQEIDKPKIKEGEALIQVQASGVCGSDLPRVLGDASHYYPNVFGHEFSGIVTQVEENSKGIKVGDKVAVAPLIPCHKCEDCLSGNHALCKHYSFIGSREYGAWAEYVKVPITNIVKLPEATDMISGAFLEPLTVALHGLFLMDFKPMSTVAITGMGTIGLLTLQCAKHMGAKEITVFDVDDEKLKIAKELGADYTVNTMHPEFRDEIHKITQGRGFEMVLETAGVPVTEMLCLEIAGNKGSVMYIGTPHKAFTIEPKQFEYMNRKELTVKGSWMSYSTPFPGREWTIGAQYLGEGKIRVEPLIGRTVQIEALPDAFRDIKDGKISGKVIITF